MCEHSGRATRDAKIRIILCEVYDPVTDIKLKRTDTTLDLSRRQRELKRKGKILESRRKDVFIYYLS